MTTVEDARLYAAAGFSVIPIRTDGTKAPACGSWRHFQERIPTEDELIQLFVTGVGVAIIAGRVSGHLEVLDCEADAPFDKWQDLIKSQDPELASRTVIVQTPSGGHHVFYRCPSGVEGNQKLAMRNGLNGKPKVLIETRGEGGYVLAVGSPPECHPTLKPYVAIQGSLVPDSKLPGIPTITADQRALLLNAARSFNEVPRQRTEPTPGKSKSGSRPGDEFNTRASWTDLLIPEGWEQVQRSGNVTYWRRPGKSYGISATTNYNEPDLLHVFTTNASPFEHDCNYTKFAAYTFLTHNGDFAAAAADLRTQGYGEKENPASAPTLTEGASRWTLALSAPAFIKSEDADIDWLDYPFLAPGSITEMFSPRGVGKTHVALAKAVVVARQGIRVLLLDRDNPRREVRRRLKAWGALDTPNLSVMTRNQVPPLTDTVQWAQFPFHDYDLMIIDSLDSSTEGIGEKDSSKPSRAIAPLLDIAHRADGPAILVLGNTIKSGAHSRGSGIIEDRADICYEVRDATDLNPTGQKAWWEELPAAGADAWAQRATRRQQRDVYRLAFISSKFRIGEEPEPLLLEVDLSGDRWGLRDVTAQINEEANVAATNGQLDAQARLDETLNSLVQELRGRSSDDGPMLFERDAVPFLVNRGLTRQAARDAINGNQGRRWRISMLTSRPGKPRVLVPLPVRVHSLTEKPDPAAEIEQSETPLTTITLEPPISADRINIDRQKSDLLTPLPVKASSDPRLFPPSPDEPGDSHPSSTVGSEDRI